MQEDPTMSVSIAPTSPRRPRKRTGPTVSILILNAISSYGGSRGVSLVALKKALKASGYDVSRNRARIRLALRRLVAKNVIMRKGASGSFKLNPNPPGARKKGAVRTERRPKKKRRRARGKGKGKGKRRKAQGRRTKRGRPRRRRKKATPARKRSTKKRRRRRRRAPRRKTPKRTRRIRRKRPKSAKVQNRRWSRTSKTECE
ncbi:protamine-like protein [Syngnathus acus]|uniref:protamine-like protein n=1 Tax=Syngnathus acus TaxID=161584 RepID=UPI0018861C33|nr:protamine-like protein [Syngnathus acus]